MIGYVTVGTNEIGRASAFYDKLFESIGGSRIFEPDNSVIWGFGPTAAAFGVVKPFDGNPATVGNGVMIALSMMSKDKVKSFYNEAIKLGAKDEGAPGQRSDTFYAAYFRDMDGHKICAFYMT